MKRVNEADAALRRLRTRITAISAVLCGTLLAAMAMFALSISQGQIASGVESAFRSNIGAVTAKLRSDRVLANTWLAETEASERMIIGITDAGTPLRFAGSWQSKTEREILIGRARSESAERGVDAFSPPPSLIDTTESGIFEVRGDHGDRYMAAVVLVSAHGGWQSVTVLRSADEHIAALRTLRLEFAALALAGEAVLVLLSWIVAGRAIEPVAESRRRQTEFIAAASHELRSPLSVIRASAAAAGGSEDSTRFLDSIDRECERMGRLVDDLLLLARTDSDRWTLEPTDIDTDTLLIETYEDFEPMARERGQSLKLELPDRALPTVRADAARVRQILGVLLDNALCYTPSGGKIVLSAEAVNGAIHFRVSDSGGGISQRDASRIFDRFYRADSSRGDKQHFGLGLPIARGLAELHGGRLTLERTDERGSVFLFELPR